MSRQHSIPEEESNNASGGSLGRGGRRQESILEEEGGGGDTGEGEGEKEGASPLLREGFLVLTG